MQYIGLTGGIGCGKSLVARVFEVLGVGVFYSDDYAKSLYMQDEFLHLLQESFGSGVVENGVLNRQRLSDMVFGDKEALQRLNDMVHPRVWQGFVNWSERRCGPYVIMESAILFETHWQDRFFKMVGIYSPLDIVTRRVLQRDNTDVERLKRRLANQMPPEKKASMSDYAIIHDEERMLLPQILEIHSDLIQKTKKRNKE